MRVYLYAGPSKRLDADWFFLKVALDRIPDIEPYLFECHGRSDFHGQRDLTLVMDHDLELFGEARPTWQPPRPFTLITERAEGKRLLWEGAERTLRLLPSAEPLLWHQETSGDPAWDVGQYGKLEYDTDVLDRVFHAFPSFSLDGGQVLEQAVERLARCRVVFVDDAPRRLMEALCLGKPVVTRRQAWHAEVGLLSGTHYWAYETPAEAQEVITLTMSVKSIADGLSAHAKAWVRHGHTWMHRACEVLGRDNVPESDIQRWTDAPLREMSEQDRQLGMPLLQVRA